VKPFIEELEEIRDIIRRVSETHASQCCEMWRWRDLKLRDALQRIQKEIGVPTPDYPSNITNAYNIAKETLSEKHSS